ncbi:hypothetical protein PR202_gb29075 [Eleusine coracana subsp. coracana]|uniref:Uncharacterized protein n=1 Tax=Eleusine coracana subsp. coracana TaxID=191504 RepID=A0AAV5FYH3_ELECO|nr:hypothetical protein QOZ80_8BG0641930 [Eleusine coracana subsp. coracana]GJN39921.1 hypothetical protein PR202_gb29075 [Eleusine coracana subsp. coracana]
MVMAITSSYALMLLPLPLLALLLLSIFLLLRPAAAAAATSWGKQQQSRIRHGSSKKKLPLPPSPPGGLPIIGHLHLIRAQPHLALRDLAKKHGDLMLLRLGAVPNLIISSARAAEAVMRTHDHVFASRPRSTLVDILFKGSLDVAFSPYGEQWRQSRKLVTAHLLTVKKVRSFAHARHDEVRLAIARIRDHARTVVDMSDLLYSFSNDLVCRAVSGKFFMEEGRNQLFRELIGMNTAFLDGFHVQDYFPRLAQFDLLTRVLSGKVKKLQERWHQLLDKLIDAHANKSSSRNLIDNARNEQETDFIDVLLSLQQEYGLTRDQMKAILMDMFAAGTDTSSITMEYALAELVRNPCIMAKLQAEVRRNTPSNQEMVMEENLGNMTYLKAVIKETLRLHPPVPLLLPHQSMVDCTVDGYLIPAQTRVIINAWAISRDPRSWDRAEEFIPERFITGSTVGVDFKGSDFQFTPFGAGRRICPGLNFALATVETMLANLIYCFDWELPTGKEDIDMTKVFGVTMHRKEKLFLVPMPFDVYHVLEN